jgi:hypothetical protein
VRRTARAAAPAVLAAALLSALAPGDAVRAQPLGSRQAHEQYLRLEWQPGQTRRGLPTVWGYVHNASGSSLGNVRLSIQELDAGGRPVSTTVGYVDGVIGPRGYAYFEIRVPRPAMQYRVTVLHYDLVVAPGGGP